MTVTLERITVQFSHKTALDSVSSFFNEGAIHALVGENGAGKSTLAAVLSGDRLPTSGRILLDGSEVLLKNPRHAVELGIVQVHQRPLLAGGITVKENILLGTEYSASRKTILKRLSDLTKTWSKDFSLNSLVRNIGGDERFMTALFASLCKKPSVLILDEPSALLNWEQRRLLYANLRTLAKKGMNIIIITHSMEEAALYTDTVTVLGRGQIIADYPRSSDFKPGSKGYIDFKVLQNSCRTTVTAVHKNQLSPAFMTFDNVTVKPYDRPALFNISFTAKSGELTLIRGLQESGLGTLENLITGMETARCSGIFKTPYHTYNLALRPLSPRILRKSDGIRTAIVPSNRAFRGSNPTLTVEQILTVYYTGPNPEKYAETLIQRAQISITPKEPAINLSGGMLQRLILERELDTLPSFLIMCEPLQGLDSQSSSALCSRIYDLVQNETAVIVLSASDFPDTCCSSVYTLRDGRLQTDRETAS